MNDRFRSLDADRFDVVVVGAGMGGLVAAALLAKNGSRVLVLDHHYVAGGNATVFHRPGYEFDVGVHYIGLCGPDGTIRRILGAAGAVDLEFEELDPDGYDTLVFPDLRIRIPKGIEAFRRRLIEHFPDERAGIDRYARILRQLERLSSIQERPLSALWKLPLSRLALKYMNASFAELLDDCTDDPRLKAVLAGQSGDYAQPPSRAAAFMGVGLTLHYLQQGAFYPKGGGQAMADRLAESIERNQGKILLRTLVEKIEVEGRRVRGVWIQSKHLGRRFIRANRVISNADIKQTMTRLIAPEHLRPETVSKTEAYEMSPALGMVYLGLQRDLKAEHHPRTNYWIYPSYDIEEGYARTVRGEQLEEPFAFVSIASLKDPTNPRLAPEGVTNFELMGLAPSQPEAWGVSAEEVADGSYRKLESYREAKVRYADRLLETAKRVFPSIREEIVFQEVSTPLTHARYTRSSGGTSYGIALTPAQFLKNRPSSRTEIEGLYLCGASTRSGHGIGGVTMSGLQAAGQILGREFVRDVLTSKPTGSLESAQHPSFLDPQTET